MSVEINYKDICPEHRDAEFRKTLRWLLSESKYYGEGGPMKSHLHENPDSKVYLVTGDNATGKSFLVQCLHSLYKKNGVGSMILSMSQRASGGTGSIMRAMVYGGKESEESSGVMSVNAARLMINSCAGEYDPDNSRGPSIAVMDEAEVGLSESYQAALGRFVAENIPGLHKRPDVCGLFIISHSRTLVRELIKDHTPNHIAMGEDETLDHWLNNIGHKSIEDLWDLKKSARKLYNDIERLH